MWLVSGVQSQSPPLGSLCPGPDASVSMQQATVVMHKDNSCGGTQAAGVQTPLASGP